MLLGFMVKEGSDDFVKLHGYLFTQKLLPPDKGMYVASQQYAEKRRHCN